MYSRDLFISSRILFWVTLCVSVIVPFCSYAGIEFASLLPNPIWDDTLWEYIEIRNTGCQTVNIWGYRLSDASQKSYSIPAGTDIPSHSNLSFPYSQTKISLNNSGYETITLTSATGAIIDTESYSGTQRDDVVIYLTMTEESCDTTTIIVESHTGNTNTGTSSIGATNTGATDVGSWTIDTSLWQSSGTTNTGIIQNPPLSPTTEEGSGSVSTGAMSSGSINTGTTNTGSTDIWSWAIDNSVWQSSGTTNIGNTNTWVLFPDIFPTRQEPTNATLSGNIWECGSNQLCRVNMTFDPIFTGWLLARDYICEVITATGVLTTCNPNTLYFSTDSSFALRLTSKLDPSQSRMMRWDVRFIVVQMSSSTGWIIATLSGASDNSESQSTGAIYPGTTDTWVIFPDIVPTWQNYTNTTHSWDTLTCITSSCRVNFTLDPIFTGSIIARDFICQIGYGNGVYDCNPPQLYLIGTGAIEIVLTHRSSWYKSYKTLEVLQNIPVLATTTQWVNPPLSIASRDTNPPIIILEFDGKIQSYYEQIDTYEFNCHTLTCSINLSADRSYDPEWGSIRYLWYYGPNDIKTTRDPGGRKYSTWDHEIWLRVIDSSGNMSEVRYHIHVLGPRPVWDLIKPEKKTKIKKETSWIVEKPLWHKKKKKPKKLVFFDPPKIILQKSKFMQQNNRYLCRTTTKNCSLNF